MRLSLTTLLTSALAATAACGPLPDPRSASDFTYAPVQAEFSGAAPAALADPAEPTGAATCGETACPKIRDVLRTIFDASDLRSVTALLTRIDAHMAELKLRAEDHFVPCLEESSTTTTVGLGDGIVFNPEFHCYMHYPSPTEPDKFPFHEQLLFSRGDVVAPFVADRQGMNDDNVVTIWVRRDPVEGALDIWRATSQTLANAGKTFLRARLGANRAFEVTSVAYGDFSSETPLSCGIHVKGDAQRLFISGQFYPVNDASFARTPQQCSGLPVQTFCVDASTLAAVAEAECKAVGLDALALLPMKPETLQTLGPEWGKEVNIDHSDPVGRFSLSGLDIY
jgi:hypothetical protein